MNSHPQHHSTLENLSTPREHFQDLLDFTATDGGVRREEMIDRKGKSREMEEIEIADDGYKSQGTSIHDSNSFKSTSTTNLVSSSSIQTPTDSEKGLLPWFAGGRRGRGQGSYAEEFSPNSGAPSLKSRASEYVLEGDFLRSVSKLRTGSPELEASVVKIPEIESDWQVLNKNEKLAPTTSKKLTKQRPRRHTVSSVEVPSRIPTPESISIPMISKISSSSGMNGKKLKKSGGISQGYKSIAPQSREVWFAERGMEL